MDDEGVEYENERDVGDWERERSEGLIDIGNSSMEFGKATLPGHA